MKNRIIISAGVLIIAVVAVLLLSSASAPKGEQPRQASPGGRRAPMVLPVEGVVLEASPLDNKVYATGNVIAREEVDLHSEASGKVTQIRLVEGSRVEKGDLLVKINDSDLQAQLRKAEARRKLLAEKEERQRKLQAINGVSQEQYEEVKSDLVGVNADIDLLRAQIAKTEIRAPFAGVIGLRSVSEGSYLTPASTVARIQDISSVKVDFAVPEKYAGLIRKGTGIRFTVDASSRQYTGEVYAVEPKIDPATRTMRVRALSKNERGEVIPGSFAKVELLLGRNENALLVPSHALVPDAESQRAFVVRGGLASGVRVETGMRTEDMVEVTKGLAVGDTLLVSGLLQIRDGLPVKVRITR